MNEINGTFMQRYNFTENKYRNQKVKKIEESRVIY